MWTLCLLFMFFGLTTSVRRDVLEQYPECLNPEGQCECKPDPVPADRCDDTKEEEISLCDTLTNRITCALMPGADNGSLIVKIDEDASLSTSTQAIDMDYTTKMRFCNVGDGYYVVNMMDGRLCRYNDTQVPLSNDWYNVTLANDIDYYVEAVDATNTPSPAKHLNATSLGSHNILLSWEKPHRQNIFSITYQQASLNRMDGGKIVSKNYECQSNECQFNISQLNPDTTYNISVTTTPGHLNKSCIQTTSRELPGTVSNFTYDAVKPNQLSLSWHLPMDEYNARCVWYEVQYLHSAELMPRFQLSYGKSTDTLIIPSLTPGDTYNFSIAAVNRLGRGNGSELTLTMPIWAPPLRSLQGHPGGVEVSTSTLTVELSKDLFLDTYGKVTKYSVIVSETNGSMKEVLSWRDVHSDITWRPYHVSKPFSSDKAIWNFTIGDQDCSVIKAGDFCNGPLKPDTRYHVYLRAYTVVPDKYTDTIAISMRTNPDLTVERWICAVLIVVLLVSWAATLWWYGAIDYLRDRLRRILSQRLNVGAARCVPAVTCRPIRTSLFPQQFHTMITTTPNKFSEEFEELKQVGREQLCTAAALPCNQPKNRFTNMLPYDHSRFKLRPVNEECSDYINANYVPGYNSMHGFIATQGPLASTRNDFWRMCWQSNASSIVMLTQCKEKNLDKCDHYWPYDSNTVHYGDVAVTKLDVILFCDWSISDLLLCKGVEKRRIKHFQFKSWPDYGVPRPPSLLVRFVRTVREHVAPDHRPVVVHCSAGVGRTGTFIALDRILQQLLHRAEYVDIFGTVRGMRKARMLLVHTLHQYVCIHACIAGVLNAVAMEHSRRSTLALPPPKNVHYNDSFQGEAES